MTIPVDWDVFASIQTKSVYAFSVVNVCVRACVRFQNIVSSSIDLGYSVQL